MSFKLGDKVRIRTTSRWYRSDGMDNNNPINTVGTIVECSSVGWYIVHWNQQFDTIAKYLTNSYSDRDLEFNNTMTPKQHIRRHEF